MARGCGNSQEGGKKWWRWSSLQGVHLCSSRTWRLVVSMGITALLLQRRKGQDSCSLPLRDFLGTVAATVMAPPAAPPSCWPITYHRDCKDGALTFPASWQLRVTQRPRSGRWHVNNKSTKQDRQLFWCLGLLLISILTLGSQLISGPHTPQGTSLKRNSVSNLNLEW